MKLFYDTDGKVIGSFEGATEEIEGRVGIPSNAHSSVTADVDITNRLNDPLDPLQAHMLIVNINLDSGNRAVTIDKDGITQSQYTGRGSRLQR